MRGVRSAFVAGLVLSLASCSGPWGASTPAAGPRVGPAVLPNAYSENLIWDFADQGDGSSPLNAGVIADANGDLYTTTQTGGTGKGTGFGTVDEFISSGSKWSESTLHSFIGSDGSTPNAPVIFDKQGNIYGTTLLGGSTYHSGCNSNGCGTVFELKHGSGGWSESILYSFTDGADGGYPQGPLAFDQSGNLFGTTEGGGNSACPLLGGCGTVFELTHASGWKESVVHAFAGKDGEYPYTRLAIDSHGDIFGTAPKGGSGCGSIGCGLVFELAKAGSSWTEKVIHAFTNGKDGGSPYGGLLADSKGNLYGTAEAGGTHNYGVAYKLTKSGSGWKQQVLFDFSRTMAVYTPYGELAFDARGNIFGVADGGNTCTVGRNRFSCGVIYELAPAKKGPWKETTRFSFGFNTGGWDPNGALLVDGSENIFGTTQKADVNGAGCCGAVYELVTASYAARSAPGSSTGAPQAPFVQR